MWCERRRHPDPGRHQDGQVFRRHADRVRLEFGGRLLTLIGYSVTDKVVVYDRIRENLGKYRAMPLRQLIDLSINQTLGRTVAISLTVLLSILPLALISGAVMRGFGWAIIFGIVIGTSSSIFIASPILLFLGEKRLRPSQAPAPQPTARTAAP